MCYSIPLAGEALERSVHNGRVSMQAALPAPANSPGKYAIPAPRDMEPGLFNYHVPGLPETLACSVLELFTERHKAEASCSSELPLVLLQPLEKGKGRPGKS